MKLIFTAIALLFVLVLTGCDTEVNTTTVPERREYNKAELQKFRVQAQKFLNKESNGLPKGCPYPLGDKFTPDIEWTLGSSECGLIRLQLIELRKMDIKELPF